MMYTNHMLGKLFTIIILFLGGQNIFSATLTVCAVGCTHTTITAAIAAAAPTGDIIDIQDPLNTEFNIMVNKSLTIQGQGQATTIVQAAATAGTAGGRVFDVASGLTVTFQDMTIRHGNAIGDGGGVFINSNATTNISFNRVMVSDNESGDEGGGVFVDGMDGTFTFTDCTISNNIAQDDGGGIYVEQNHNITLTNCVINDNSTNNDDGGGISLENDNTLNLVDCTIERNVSADNGGGIYLEDMNNVMLINTTIDDNDANGDGGGMYAQPASTIDFTDCIVSNNETFSNGQGGGLFIDCDANTNLTFDNTIIRNNESDNEGGGIYFRGSDGTATFTNCVLHDNQANANGANANADGGAIKNLGISNLIMTGCSLYNNQAPDEGGAIDLSEAGATATFTNCTIASNTTINGHGSGINFDEGDAIFINCSIVDNNSTNSDDGIGIYMHSATTSLTLTNTIIANNTGSTTTVDLEIADPTDTHTFNTSLVENCPSCVTVPTYTTDPNLAAQATCGNQIYYEPQIPSDALDNAAAPGGAIPSTDICGNARTGGPNTLGSFFVAPPPVVVVGGGASIPTVSEWGMILLVLLMITLQLATSKILCLGENAASGSLNFRLLPFDAPVFLRYSLLVLLGLVALFTLAIALFGYTLTSADPVGSVLSAVVLGYMVMLLQAE